VCCGCDGDDEDKKVFFASFMTREEGIEKRMIVVKVQL